MCVVEQNNLCCSRRGPLLCKHRPLGVGWTRAECRRCRGWNMIWMAHAEMGNITLEAYSTCPHALKIQGFITPQLWCICENFNVYCGGPSQCCDVCINITRPRCVFFFFFCCLWTQHGELITVASFVCLRRSAGQQRNSEWIVSACFVGFCPIWKTGEINVFSIFGAETRLSTIDLWLSEWCH